MTSNVLTVIDTHRTAIITLCVLNEWVGFIFDLSLPSLFCFILGIPNNNPTTSKTAPERTPMRVDSDNGSSYRLTSRKASPAAKKTLALSFVFLVTALLTLGQ